MGAFLVKRLGFAVVTLWAVLSLVFVVVRIVPGDPAQVILGDQADATAIAAMRTRLGLDAASSSSNTGPSSAARSAATGASRSSPAGR
jgi:ABC-type dipeptide/oligopeptide/nickel transport system permease component